jgi:hypothetical protein
MRRSTGVARLGSSLINTAQFGRENGFATIPLDKRFALLPLQPLRRTRPRCQNRAVRLPIFRNLHRADAVEEIGSDVIRHCFANRRQRPVVVGAPAGGAGSRSALGVRNGHTTALVTDGCQSFLDNVIADLGQIGSWSDRHNGSQDHTVRPVSARNCEFAMDTRTMTSGAGLLSLPLERYSANRECRKMRNVFASS